MENSKLIDAVHDEINSIGSEIDLLQSKLRDRQDYLNKLRNDNAFNEAFKDSTKDQIQIDFKIITNCKQNSDTKDPWTNIIINSGKYIGSKHTIKYPESYKFNSDMKELILKYVNGGATVEDVSIVDENEKLREEIEKLREENRILKNKDMCHNEAIEAMKMFNSFSWWVKMRFKFKV